MICRLTLVLLLLSQIGCAGHTKKIAGGMLAGAAVGAVVGYQYIHHGTNRQYETQNTIVTSIVFSLITGGILAWHYRELEEAKVEISGRYARYRLCDPEEMKLAGQLAQGGMMSCSNHQIDPKQIGPSAIFLDDNTKWAYPSFRKRYLQPDGGERQLLSRRYIWEILTPGRFVTRSQHPHFFSEEEAEDGNVDTKTIEQENVNE